MTNETALREALSLAANRLARCALDQEMFTEKYYQVAEWGEEARAAALLQSPSQPVIMAIEQCGECVGTGCGPVVDGADTTCATCKGSGNAPGAQWYEVSSQPVVAGAVDPDGWLVERLRGEGYGKPRKVIDARQYDASSDDFWTSPEAKARHRITPLYAHPQASPPPVQSERVTRYLSDRFEWAAPGDQQEDAWLLRFCDKDRREAIWTGPDAEREAWAAWEQYAPTYNCYVFRLARLAHSDTQEGEA